MKNIFVIGIDDHNSQMLYTIRGADDMRFHSLLSFEEIVAADAYEIDQWLERARRQLERHSGSVDAIVGYWDFPSVIMRPLFRELVDLGGPSLESLLRCEHKVWARMEQADCIPESTPRFSAFDPFGADPWSDIELEPPFWIKPVMAHSAVLGFRIDSREDFDEALERIRGRAHRFADPLQWILDQAELPDEISELGGYGFIAEELISRDRQCTLEGFSLDGEHHVYGVIDSIREGRHGSSFARYQYPSRLPPPVIERMVEKAQAVVDHARLDRCPWNIEFYWDPVLDSIYLLEVNTRVSQSHAPMFWHVDGRAHFEVMVDLGLGIKPQMPRGRGPHRVAGKFMVRVHESDGIVRRVPSERDLENVRAVAPHTLVTLGVDEGTRLSDMRHQDSYSYEIATLFIGADSSDDLERRYREARERLGVEIEPVEADAAYGGFAAGRQSTVDSRQAQRPGLLRPDS